MSGSGCDLEGVVKLPKSDLDILKEVAPEQIAPYRDGADRGIEQKTSEVGRRKLKTMNSRGQSEHSCRIQSDFPACHQIDSQDRNYEGAVEKRKLGAGIKMGPKIC